MSEKEMNIKADNRSPEYLNTWWLQKLRQNYDVQWKHIAAAQLLTEYSFPLTDLGSGSGIFIRLIEEKFKDPVIIGVEISDVAIANKVCQSSIFQGDLSEWNPTDSTVTVSLIDVIEHIPNPEPLLKNISQFAEYILIACPNFNFIKARLDVLMGKIPFQNRVGRGGHVYWCELNALKAMFRNAGLTIVNENHLYPKNYIPWLRSALNFSPALLAHEFVFLLRSGSDLSD